MHCNNGLNNKLVESLVENKVAQETGDLKYLQDSMYDFVSTLKEIILGEYSPEFFNKYVDDALKLHGSNLEEFLKIPKMGLELRQALESIDDAIDTSNQEFKDNLVLLLDRFQTTLDNMEYEARDPYDTAVELGFEGTKEEWLEHLEGDSAYELATLNGFEGSEQEWLDHLEGDSAYEIAVSNGYVGTQSEWLKYIRADGFIQSIQQFATNDSNTPVDIPEYGEIPSLQGYIKTLFENGGISATPFRTKALLEASNLQNGSYAIVTDDTRIENRGLYNKVGGVWNKSSYSYNPKARLNNEADPNANDAEYGLTYYIGTGISVENNFPMSVGRIMLYTYKVDGSSITRQTAYIISTSLTSYERIYTGTWSEWNKVVNKTDLDLVNNELSELEKFNYLLTRDVIIPKSNLVNPEGIVAGSYWSPSESIIKTSSLYRRTEYIPVKPNTLYGITGGGVASNGVAFFKDTKNNPDSMVGYEHSTLFTTPSDAKYIVVNITNTGSNDTSFDLTLSVTEGGKKEYSPYDIAVNPQKIEGVVTKQDLYESKSFNLIDPSKVNFTKRYSTGTKSFVQDPLPIASTDYIAVEEGEWYTLSGSARYGYQSGGGQGGYFSEYGDEVAIDNINFVAPVSGRGHAFKVPTGLGIKYVVLSLNKTAENTLDGVAQLELGEMPTDYVEFEEVVQLKESLLPKKILSPSQDDGLGLNQESWFKFVHAEGVAIHQDKLPKFRKAMKLKHEDVVVVNTGTSLTARTSEHSTLYEDAAFRPPMMHSRAFCSLIWDELKWEGQQYRRYDSGYFTESGTYNTDSSLAEWDDGAYRDGLTRYSSSATASVSFEVPINAWQFNFIYRTDSLGCEATISVAEGERKLQVFDEASDTWVEAHNYVFSQLESTPVTRSVDIPSPVSTSVTPRVLASKGNTTYQKRLKMRCRNDNGSFNSLDSVKNVTISRTGGGPRFMYWGVEWSPRQYMVTYINSARGSHNTSATGTKGLPRYQDNEVWSFKPTLILAELGIHNDGAAAAGVYPVGTWAGLAHNYVTRTDYELSMFSRAAHFGNTDVEYAFFTASIAWNFGGIEEDGSLKYSLQSSSHQGKARMLSALDKYQEASEYLNSVGIPCIDVAKRWVDAGYAIFGDLKSATVGSGKAGQTFTNEGSHWNDTGSRIVAKAVIPLIKTY